MARLEQVFEFESICADFEKAELHLLSGSMSQYNIEWKGNALHNVCLSRDGTVYLAFLASVRILVPQSHLEESDQDHDSGFQLKPMRDLKLEPVLPTRIDIHSMELGANEKKLFVWAQSVAYQHIYILDLVEDARNTEQIFEAYRINKIVSYYEEYVLTPADNLIKEVSIHGPGGRYDVRLWPSPCSGFCIVYQRGTAFLVDCDGSRNAGTGEGTVNFVPDPTRMGQVEAASIYAERSILIYVVKRQLWRAKIRLEDGKHVLSQERSPVGELPSNVAPSAGIAVSATEQYPEVLLWSKTGDVIRVPLFGG